MTKKLDKEHLDAIQELRLKFGQNANILGSITIEEYTITSQLKELETEKQRLIDQFQELRTEESALLTRLKDRYGDGQINIEDGTFTAAE
jgi:predicted transcriptional regulator